MSSDAQNFLDKMEAFVKKAKQAGASNDSGWKSRKLWVTVGSVIAFIFLFKLTLPTIAWPLTAIICVYLLTQSYVDGKKEDNKGRTKDLLLDKFSQDGITEEELDVVKRVLNE